MAANSLGDAADFFRLREQMRSRYQEKLVRDEVRETASKNFLAFTMHTKPDYYPGWFGADLHAALDRFLAQVVRHQSPRLMVLAPPRHGKSEASSRRLPAYALGRHPWLEIILWSYAASLAENMNEAVQKIMDGTEFKTIFPDVRIPPPGAGTYGGKRNRQETHVLGHGGRLRASGVGGGVTGNGAHILVIDDPFKDDQDSGSAAAREKVWNRYVSTAYTRLAPGGGILLTQTCWHEDDLAGRLQDATKKAIAENDPDADRWEVIQFPAIATHNEKHRKKGEALAPHRYDLKALRRIKKTVGSYFWSALYQQSPNPAEGDIFLVGWWRYWRALPPLVLIKIYADTAMKTRERNDWSCFQVWGLSREGQIYLLDQIHGKWESPELDRQARAFWSKWKAKPLGPAQPSPSQMMIEDKASGTGLVQSLRTGEGAIPVRGIQRDVDKVVRAKSSAPSIEAGNVFLPSPQEHPNGWLSDYLDEFVKFTAAMSHAHDDQVDPTMDAIHDLILGNADFYGQALG
jgi:predicted phage terminase large subunit-like protein